MLYVKFYVGKIRHIYVLVAAATRGFTTVSFTEAVSRRNTFVGGTCAPTSAFLVLIFFCSFRVVD